jgi:hypothetical protein
MREEEAMSVHIVDDEQRSDRRATLMRPSGSGLAGTSASLALLDDVHRHRPEARTAFLASLMPFLNGRFK